jgi:hypothetical protein
MYSNFVRGTHHEWPRWPAANSKLPLLQKNTEQPHTEQKDEPINQQKRTQDTPDTKFHYNVHKNPPPVPIPSQINPVYITESYLSKVHFNIILSPTSGPP